MSVGLALPLRPGHATPAKRRTVAGARIDLCYDRKASTPNLTAGCESLEGEPFDYFEERAKSCINGVNVLRRFMVAFANANVRVCLG